MRHRNYRSAKKCNCEQSDYDIPGSMHSGIAVWLDYIEIESKDSDQESRRVNNPSRIWFLE